MTDQIPPAARLIDVTKRYGATTALSGVTLELPAGQVVGLLGRNGAGKTTLLSLMAGFLEPTTGSIEVLGCSPARARQRLGFAPERPDYHLAFSARDLLRRFAAMRGMPKEDAGERCGAALQDVGLSGEAADRRLSRYSKGMLQRFSLAQCLLGDPDLLVLDEPMSGLDPLGQADVRAIVSRLRRPGRTIVLSSHLLDHLERVCDSVVLVENGSVAYHGPASSGGDTHVRTGLPLTPAHGAALRRLGARIVGERELLVPSAEGAEGRARVLRHLLEQGLDVERLTTSNGLEELFLDHVGGGGRPREDGRRPA